VYGGRWELVGGPELGHGGQGTVFRVKDRFGEHQGEYALKRVPDINRRERFRREIDAIKRLTDRDTQQTHPYIISLIDHSALDDTGNQFLVMPIANGGDLSDPGRFSLYKDSIDGVLQVAKQIARALSAAHAAEIIHRDVKPANILFTGRGHELWLSDFGICLIREAPRMTEPPEVMGPRAFMAPELEQGGQLEVTPSADIYSLGKVIFYMLSGGDILPRERVHEGQFRKVFAKGERYSLMELLLRRMICLQDQRIQSADEVIEQLEKIEAWEKNARLLPIGVDGLAAIEQIQRRSLEAGRIASENQQVHNQETQALGAVQASVTGWLSAELRKVAAVISSDSIRCDVRDAGMPNGQLQVQIGDTSLFRALNGVELTFEDVNDPSNRGHALQFFLCKHEKFATIVAVGDRVPLPKALPASDLELAVLPFYRRTLRHLHPSNSLAPGYISRKDKIGTTRGYLEMPALAGRNVLGQVRYRRVELNSTSFDNDVTLHAAFRASEWPDNEEQLRGLLKEAIESFITLINPG
jgi:tRNA A-37 threonylcarbamoyl transferase component Bud32